MSKKAKDLKAELQALAVAAGLDEDMVKKALYSKPKASKDSFAAKREARIKELKALRKKGLVELKKLKKVTLSNKDRKGNKTKVTKFYREIDGKKVKLVVWHPDMLPEARIKSDAGTSYVPVAYKDAKSILEGKTEAVFTLRKRKTSKKS